MVPWSYLKASRRSQHRGDGSSHLAECQDREKWGQAVARIPFVLCDRSALAMRKLRSFARGLISGRLSTGERWSNVQQRGSMVSCGEGETSGLIEEMDGIEWMDVDGIVSQRVTRVVRGIPCQGLEISCIPSRRKGERLRAGAMRRWAITVQVGIWKSEARIHQQNRMHLADLAPDEPSAPVTKARISIHNDLSILRTISTTTLSIAAPTSGKIPQAIETYVVSIVLIEL
ncbi:hypothetical protein B0H13DRAFT_2440998 [Mycena leptocephala]|nr:hypothetical protein B0H13DRAFT_2440998 [Mycena leptocephala]